MTTAWSELKSDHRTSHAPIMNQERKILLPYLLVGALLIVSVAFFVYDARTIIDAEETEEDSSKILLMMGSYLNGLQQTQIEQYQFLLSGEDRRLQSYELEKQRSINRIAALHQVVAEDFHESLPKIDAIQKIQTMYLSELDKSVQAQVGARQPKRGRFVESRYVQFYLQQIQLLLAQTEADINEIRQTINQNVSFSVKRASISIVLVAVLLITILGLGYWTTARALAENRLLAETLAHEATHDTLTLLPNRRYFLGWLDKTIAMAQRNKFSIALYFIDLDGFKQVNDLFGHEAGDEVLRVATSRFQGLLRESDLLARLGGDEFAILVSQAPKNEELSALAERILAALAAPIGIGRQTAGVGASVGIAVFPRDADSSDSLLRAADEAMYQAKAQGKNRYCFYAPSPVSPS